MGLSCPVGCAFAVFFWEVILSVPVLDDRKTLADTLSYLRYPGQKAV